MLWYATDHESVAHSSFAFDENAGDRLKSGAKKRKTMEVLEKCLDLFRLAQKEEEAGQIAIAQVHFFELADYLNRIRDEKSKHTKKAEQHAEHACRILARTAKVHHRFVSSFCAQVSPLFALFFFADSCRAEALDKLLTAETRIKPTLRPPNESPKAAPKRAAQPKTHGANLLQNQTVSSRFAHCTCNSPMSSRVSVAIKRQSADSGNETALLQRHDYASCQCEAASRHMPSIIAQIRRPVIPAYHSECKGCIVATSC